MRIVLVTIIIVLGLAVGTIVLQIFLSKMESKWTGLILPIITVLFSIVAALSVPVSWEQEATTIIENGRVTAQAAENASGLPVQSVGSAIAAVAGTFLIGNIPTAVYLAVYLGVREKRRREKLLEKMQAQDL